MKYGKFLAVFLALVGCACMFLGGEASGGGIKKIDPKLFKKIINKIDGEVKAAQTALAKAKADLLIAVKRIDAAMADEVFGEKGATEGKVIDELKLALNSTKKALIDVNFAIKHANIAQLVDKGGD